MRPAGPTPRRVHAVPLGRCGTIGGVSEAGVNPPSAPGAGAGDPGAAAPCPSPVGAVAPPALDGRHDRRDADHPAGDRGFVALRGFTRDQGEVEVPPVDYLDAVARGRRRRAGARAPPRAARGLARHQRGPRPGRVARVDDGDADRRRALRRDPPGGGVGRRHGRGGARRGRRGGRRGHRCDSDLADTWTTWTDEGGDTGYAAELGDETVLVYGSAPAEDLEEVIALLQR